MKVKAKAKYIRTAPRKLRLLADLVRGLDVKEAELRLRYSNKATASAIIKLLASVVANGVEGFELKDDNLYIKEITVDEGPTLKRWRPRAFGRATPIRKRSSHISIVLDERVPTDPKKIKKEKIADDIVKVSGVKQLEEVEKKDEDIDDKKEKINKKNKIKKNKKGFASNIFNRKSGER